MLCRGVSIDYCLLNLLCYVISVVITASATPRNYCFYCRNNLHFQTRVVDFRCVINCGLEVIPSLKLSIKSICSGLECRNITTYDWVLYEKNESNSNSRMAWQKRSDLQLITSTALNSSAIVIKENSLIGGRQYRLVVYVWIVNSLVGVSTYNISTAPQLIQGKCSILPPSGYSFTTNFTLSCSGWESNNAPLWYNFQYRFPNDLYSVIYYGPNYYAIFQLPTGFRLYNYTLDFIITVHNLFTFSEVSNISVKVGFCYYLFAKG